MNAKPEEIVSLLREEIEGYDNKTRRTEEGTVLEVGDGIATIYGLDRAVYGELVEFDTGVRGMVMDLSRDTVGCVLLGAETGLREGSTVRRTGQPADVPVGEGMLGRVVDALGRPIDGLGPIHTTERRPIEHEASGVITREPVTVPLQTGILAIDAMVPIGRGQRELLIGDRQTGKTAIAVDTILNQKGQDVICIYVPSARRPPRWPGCGTPSRSTGPWTTPSSCPPPPASPPPCSTSPPTPGRPWGSTSWTKGRMYSSSMTT